jgi:thioredoxin 1
MTELVPENIETTIKDNNKVMLKLYVRSCAPCKSPVYIASLERLSAETGIPIFSVDAQLAADFAVQVGIRAVPTLLIYENGELKSTIVGVKTIDEMQEIVKTIYVN